MDELKIFTTGDGSHSIRVSGLDENYHSGFGAITESNHIFIEAGLLPTSEKKLNINILEIGFGTGLNALLTYLTGEKKLVQIDYTAIDLFPLNNSLVRKLNYPSLVNCPCADEIFYRLHDAEWNCQVTVSENFRLTKIHQDILVYQPDENNYDLIYFDAFGPDKQPELWSDNIFKKLSLSLVPGGSLVTYSTKGEVKRALKRTGFSLEKLPGPPGKREILRATLSGQPLNFVSYRFPE